MSHDAAPRDADTGEARKIPIQAARKATPAFLMCTHTHIKKAGVGKRDCTQNLYSNRSPVANTSARDGVAPKHTQNCEADDIGLAGCCAPFCVQTHRDQQIFALDDIVWRKGVTGQAVGGPSPEGLGVTPVCP